MTIHEGMPITTIARTVADLLNSGGRIDVIRQAISDARREGFIGDAEARQLRRRVEGHLKSTSCRPERNGTGDPMSSTPKPPERLEKRLAGIAREQGIDQERLRRWVSFLALCGVLERAMQEGVLGAYYLKGGVAMELRFAQRARATKDLDLGIEGSRMSRMQTAIGCLTFGFRPVHISTQSPELGTWNRPTQFASRLPCNIEPARGRRLKSISGRQDGPGRPD